MLAYSNAGLIIADTKRSYDEAQLCAGLFTYGAKAYSNAAVCMSTNAEAYYNADAHECNRFNPITGCSQNASATIEVHALCMRHRTKPLPLLLVPQLRVKQW